ncbi:hypothetical protein QQS21_003975 [Conoideocrella luteorostrata]|uniref:Uncharacterized protein n=1 Tax=Conoideocrella luteorostrata TaxID=1105319 RepID=A0AAJ0G070_9HYPO|nr:hypothetical protein QQS21_003975 [Conoideocrella luteorostrata]
MDSHNERYFPHSQPPKSFSWSHAKLSKMSDDSSSNIVRPKDTLRPHQLRYFAQELSKHHSPKPHRRTTSRPSPNNDPEESLAIAHSDVPLPGEKQWPSHFGVKCLPSIADTPEISINHLYDMGLLNADDAELREPRFGLNDITHNGPLYTLNVRPAKRRTKRRAALAAAEVDDRNSDDAVGGPPSPTFSYYDIGGDEALATFAMNEDDYVDLGSDCSA